MIVPKSWGHEDVVINGPYCVKKLVYTRCVASSLHYHEKKHETFTALSGLFKVWVGGDLENGPERLIEAFRPGDSVVLPPRTLHRIWCLTPGTILESSTVDDPSDCVRLVPSEG